MRRKRDPVKNYPERKDAKATREQRNPPLHGEGSNDWTDYFHSMYIPVLFMAVWIALLVTVVFDVFGRHADWIKEYWLTAVFLVVAFVLGGLILGPKWRSRAEPGAAADRGRM